MKNIFKYRKRIYIFLYDCIKGRRKILLGYAIFLFVAAVIELLTPQLYSKFVDDVLIQGDTKKFYLIILGYCVLFLVGGISAIGGRTCLNKLMNALEYRLRLLALSRILNPNINEEKDSDRTIGNIKIRMDNDISKLSVFLQEQLGKYEIQMILTIGAGGILLALNWQLALLGIAAVPVTLFLDYVISKKENKLNESNRQNDSSMSTWLYAVVRGWKQVRMFQLEKRQERRYVKYQHNYALYNAKWINFWVTRCLIIPKIKNEFLMEFGVYFIGGIFIFQNKITVGELLVFIVYYHIMTNAMTALSAFSAQLQADMPIYERALSWTLTDSESKGDITIDEIAHVDMKDVGFWYSPDMPVLFKNLNHYFEKGDCVGITGKSGSGKTTLIKLLLGTNKPQAGSIFINNQSLQNINMVSYYDKISGVMQGMHLFHASVRENLLYACPNADENEITEACRKAQILNDIYGLSNGFDTVIGEHGTGLSGGQCQRLLLARAFLKKADVYIFDEVTSALDEKNSKLIFHEIKKLSEKKIVFLISHDENAYKICNKMIKV